MAFIAGRDPQLNVTFEPQYTIVVDVGAPNGLLNPDGCAAWQANS